MFKPNGTLCVLFLLIRTISGFRSGFRNPLSLGADPFVHFDSLTGSYFVLFTRGLDIAIYSVASLNDLDGTEPTRWAYDIPVLQGKTVHPTLIHVGLGTRSGCQLQPLTSAALILQPACMQSLVQ